VGFCSITNRLWTSAVHFPQSPSIGHHVGSHGGLTVLCSFDPQRPFHLVMSGVWGSVAQAPSPAEQETIGARANVSTSNCWDGWLARQPGFKKSEDTPT
jgi:hypothetical protein